MNVNETIEQVFEHSNQLFEQLALQIFYFQAENNKIYKDYLKYLHVKPSHVHNIYEIPFLPVEFFKTQRVLTENGHFEMVFSSSGTTGKNTSKHYVKDLSLYKKSFQRGFELFYGKPDDYCILALLPSYLERKGSSLVYMVQTLIETGGNPDSGFYLHNFKELAQKLEELNNKPYKVLLIGVSFALIELAEHYPVELLNTIIMETGGMKGKRKELTREELHNYLKEKFKVNAIHSEYGMTELLSQAYSKGNGKFNCPAWMKILIRDTYDPFSYTDKTGKTGGINIIDLANINSCAFVETKDLGKINPDGSFEVTGRFDNSDIRGCNLLF